MPPLLWAAAVAAVGLLADLSTKQWVWTNLRAHDTIVVIPKVLHLDFAFNTGSAFGMFSDQPWARSFFIVVTIAAMAYVGRLLWTLPRDRPLPFVALGLVVAGAVGNLHDRLVRTLPDRVHLQHGMRFDEMLTYGPDLAKAMSRGRTWVDIPRHGVVDFIVIYYWPGRVWPAFNIADTCLCIGVGLFMLYLWRSTRDAPQT